MWEYKHITGEQADKYKSRYIAVNTCEQCGVEFIAKNPATTKYCPECVKGIRNAQARERMRKARERKKQAKPDTANQ